MRLRYLKDPQTQNYYTKPVLCGPEMIVVNISVKDNLMTFCSFDTGVVRLVTGVETLAKAKKRAKELLMSFGANFGDEVRHRDHQHR